MHLTRTAASPQQKRHTTLAEQRGQYLRRPPDKSLRDLQHARVFCQFEQVSPQLFFVFSYFPQFCLQLLQLFLRYGETITIESIILFWKSREEES